MKKVFAFVLVLILFLFPGCKAAEKAQEMRIFTDAMGNAVSISGVPQRIASGYYIATSACLALGLEDKLVGIEDKSDKRPLYRLAAPELAARCANIGSAKQLDVEACIACNPDLVILPKKAADYASTLREAGIPTIVVNPENGEALVAMINLIAEITQTQSAAKKLLDKQSEITDFINKAANLADNLPRVYMASPSSYLSTCPKDMYQASLIRLAGGINVGDALDGNSRMEISYEQLLAMNPDVIIIPTNDMANGAPDYSAEELMNDPVLQSITAVQNGSIYTMPYGLEAWDSPVPSGVLGGLWLLKTLHPQLCAQENYEAMVTDFYQSIYGFTPNLQ